ALTNASRATDALRQPVRRAVPVLDGLAPGAVRHPRRRVAARRLAAPCARLSAAPPLRERAQVHRRLRAPRRTAARPDRGGCCRPVARGLCCPLPDPRGRPEQLIGSGGRAAPRPPRHPPPSPISTG